MSTPTKKSGGGGFLRIKKFMASRLRQDSYVYILFTFSETSGGRKMIIRFLGASGDHLLKCLDDCTTKGV